MVLPGTPRAPALVDELFRAHDEQVSQPLPVSTTTRSLPAATSGTTRAHGTRANVKNTLSPLTSISLEVAASSSDGITSLSPSQTPSVEDGLGEVFPSDEEAAASNEMLVKGDKVFLTFARVL